MPPIISVENLSKRYLVGHQSSSRERYTALRDVLARQARSFVRRTGDILRGRQIVQGDEVEEFWALRNVSFDVKEGEVVGIIGRNGAGKSTLLKILSRITDPTDGRVTLRGRVASLLEVGTGFHPELTGRENVYLNGAILGMTRIEIRKKFDEIVDFAGVEKFLDTPVKRYSSGLYVRLAFAVAAHLEPEIFVVDEVLAVGDAEFQKKCLGKMSEVARQGRTVLFVSHNMNAVERLCGRALHLNYGQLIGDYPDTRAAVVAYLRGDSCGAASMWRNSGDEYKNTVFVPMSLEVVSDVPGWSSGDAFSNAHPIKVHVGGTICTDDAALNVGIAVYDEQGLLLFWTYVKDEEEWRWPDLELGPVQLTVSLPSRWLNEGDYRVELIAGLHCRGWCLQPNVSAPSIHFSIVGGLSDSPLWDFKRPGCMAPVLPWSRTPAQDFASGSDSGIDMRIIRSHTGE